MKKNRRRVDAAKRTGELKAAAQRHGPGTMKVLGALLLGVVVVGAGVKAWQLATTSPFFALREIQVHGQARATGPELERLGGVARGMNLLTVDVAAAERALATHPWVQQATVRRTLPGRLDLTVVEHQPVAMLSLGELYLVNQDAVPFKRVTATDVMDLPLVTGLDRERFSGEGRPAALAELRRGLDLAQAYARIFPDEDDRLSEVQLGSAGVVLVTTGGQEIRLGDAAFSAELARLKRVRAELRARALSALVIRLDNRVRPDRVTVQLSEGSPERGARLK